MFNKVNYNIILACFARSFDESHIKSKKILCLAAQKFISDIATDAYQYTKVRSQGIKEKRKVILFYK